MDPLPDAPSTFDPARPWESLTLAISGYRAGSESEPILLDWFNFIGGRPAEVVYVDGGSPRPTARRLARLVNRGLIDRLELLHPKHPDNSFNRCFVQEYRAGAMATKPYILFVKLDVLPFRRGHDRWLAEDLAMLDRPGILSITLTHLVDPPTGREDPYLVYDFSSLNFSLFKRSMFHESMRTQAGAFIDAGFQGEYPPQIRCEPKHRRMLVEWSWMYHCRQFGLRTLAREESRDWSIFHINKAGRKLLAIRRRHNARDGIEPYLNIPGGLYRPPLTPAQRAGKRIEAWARTFRAGGRPPIKP